MRERPGNGISGADSGPVLRTCKSWAEN